MHIVVVGAGAIGCLLGGLLSKAGHEVTMVEKNREVVQILQGKGIGIVDLLWSPKDFSDIPWYRVKACSDPAGIETCDLVLMCVKFLDLPGAIARILHLVSEEAPLVLLQTGLGHISLSRSALGAANVLGAVTFNGSMSIGPAVTQFTARGVTLIGEPEGGPSARVRKLVEAFNAAGLPAEESDNIRGHAWTKAIMYSGINPLTAIFRVRNGKLAEEKESLDLARAIVDEGVALSKAAGIRLVYDDLFDRLVARCRETGAGISTMLQDLLNRRKTEIDALNGAIVQEGKRHRTPTPVNRAVTDIIKLEEKWGGGNQLSLMG